MGYSRAAKQCRGAQPCRPCRANGSARNQRERDARIATLSQRIATMRKGPRNKDAGKDRSGKQREKKRPAQREARQCARTRLGGNFSRLRSGLGGAAAAERTR